MAPSEPDSPISLQGERERTIELLSRHFAQDNLSVEQLEQRIEQAYRAASVPALREVTKDLPGDAVVAPLQRAVAVPEEFAHEHDRIVSVMSETKRRGVWRPPKHLDAWCVMSDTVLDLTEATLAPGVTEIHLRAMMAAVKIIVPRGIRVMLQPTSVMSTLTFDEDDFDPPVGPGTPVLQITGLILMTELKVKARTRETPLR